MLGDLFSGWHLIVIIAIVVLLFGATRLPRLAKSVGQSMRIFRGEMKNMKDENGKDADAPVESDSVEAPTTTETTARTKP
jgi:sec-independent protein translocase protein TatA